MKYLKFIFCSFCLFYSSSLFSYLEQPKLMLDIVGERVFEKLKDGRDSYVQKIDDVKKFNQIISGSGRIVALFYSEKNFDFNDDGQGYLDLANNYKNDIKFISLDIDKNKALLQKLADSLLRIILNSKLKDNNPKLHGYLTSFFKYLIIVSKGGGQVKPFVLFFKDLTLITPENFLFKDKESLDAIIKELLLGDGFLNKNKKQVTARFPIDIDNFGVDARGEMFAQNQKKKSIWRSVTSKIKQWVY